jgi:hypothetical protein
MNEGRLEHRTIKPPDLSCKLVQLLTLKGSELYSAITEVYPWEIRNVLASEIGRTSTLILVGFRNTVRMCGDVRPSLKRLEATCPVRHGM